MLRALRAYPLLVVLLAMWGVLAAITSSEPLLGDGWRHYFHAHGDPLSGEGFLDLVEDHYEELNPRWGQLVLVLASYIRAIPVAVTPTILVALVLLVAVLVRGRWLRARDTSDARLALGTLALLMLVTPQFGATWFYRPVCTNYVYPLVVQLAFCVPYRILAGRPVEWPGPALAAAVLPLGFLAGAGNEHTGGAIVVGALVAIAVGWRRDRRVPLWSVLGVIAVIAGYVFLLTAPGQDVRYAGAATKLSWFETLAARGIAGNLWPVARLLGWASPAIVITVIAAAAARWRPDRRMLLRIGVCFVLAGLVIGASLLAPMLPTRLLVAPATLLVIALGLAHEAIIASTPAVGTWLARTMTALAIAGLVFALVVQVVTGREGRARQALVEQAPRGTVLVLPRFTFDAPSRFTWGDDMRSASLRARVAQFYELAGIELGRE